MGGHLRQTVCVFLILVLAGCVKPAAEADPQPAGASLPNTTAEPEAEPPTGGNTSVPVAPNASEEDRGDAPFQVDVLEGGRVRVEVPVPVVLVGFAPEVADDLRDALVPTGLEQAVLHAEPLFASASGERDRTKIVRENALVPVPRYEVVAVSPEEALRVREVALSDGRVDPYDANAVEDYVASRLSAWGVAASKDAPALVVLNLPDLEGYTYRIALPNGDLAPVRTFGERYPVLIHDVSASRVFDSGLAYDRMLNPEGNETVEALTAFVEDAVAFRLLQGPLYPPTTAPCHGATVLVVLEDDLEGARPEVDPDRLQAAFEPLAGAGRVYVDVRTIELPGDDPGLAALLKAQRGPVFMEAVRAWVAENWEDYWVPHEGCEAYLSLVVDGDLADARVYAGLPLDCMVSTCYWGIAMHDQVSGLRFSFSLLDDYAENAMRARSEEADRAFRKYEYLAVHETGHLFGLAHPHNAILHNGTRTVFSLSTVGSSMSYLADERVTGFTVVDHANFHRNRAGWLAQAAWAAGLEDSPAFRDALDLLSEQAWVEAGSVLEGALAQAQ